MAVVKMRGIVLSEQERGESGRQIILLAKGIGKVRLTARGAKNVKSKFLAGTQLFCYGDFLAYEGRGFYSVTQIDLLESFYALRTDMEKLAEAMYLLELLDQTVPEGMAVDETLEFLLYTLQVIAKGALPPMLAGRIFELKYLQMSGLLAEFSCMHCGTRQDEMFFSFTEGCFVCGTHRAGAAERVLPAVAEAVTFVLEKEGKAAFAFLLGEEALAQLDRMMEAYLAVHMGVRCKSRGFFRTGT